MTPKPTVPRPNPRPYGQILRATTWKGARTPALTLTAVTPLAATPWDESADTLLGLSAVIETDDGRLSYWALAHPRAQPDFHHPVGWTARVPDNRRP